MNIRTLTPFFVGALLAVNAFGATIDTFSAPCANTTDSPVLGGSNANGIACAASIGGARIDMINVYAGANGISSRIQSNPPTGLISAGIDAGHMAISSLVWNGQSSAANIGLTTLGGLNLTTGGNTQINVSTKSDLGGTVTLTLFAPGVSSGTSKTIALPANGFGGSYATLTFLLSDLGGGTNVGKIQLDITGAAGMDWIIDDVVTSGVPEPASMALIGGGLLLLAGIRRRK